MSEVPAKECLTILVGYPGETGKEFVPGIIVYGLGVLDGVAGEPAPQLGECSNSFRLVGEKWEVVMWEFPMWQWPAGEAWQKRLSAFLCSMIEAGAQVAWIGYETAPYADPPSLFDPQYMLGGVFAWRTADGWVGGNLDPDRPLSPASADELLALRAYAAGLADVD